MGRLTLLFALLWAAPAAAADLTFNYAPSLGPNDKPWFSVTPARAVDRLQVTVTAGGQDYRFDKSHLAGGVPVRFDWPRDPTVTDADVDVLADFADASEEEQEISIHYTYAGNLKVDLSHARADLAQRTVTVAVTAPVQTADVVAKGARGAVLDQETVQIGAGPGEISVPFVGSPSDVVLLDVTLHSGPSFAGFTYSPWFLDIPHDDVLFDSDSDVIEPAEEPKLKATLDQLNDVLDKYGSIVPVKLYIAGCTDTMGDAGHNLDLSQRRARAIAGWLRGHGYAKPIFYHGFGEGWLQVQTGDQVDEQANRRAVYMVGANPPPPGSGVPAGAWTPL